MAQEFLRPDSNVTLTDINGGFADIDETSASDTDYLYGNDGTSAVAEIGFSNPSATPIAYTVRYRYSASDGGVAPASGGNTVTLQADVMQGATVIATRGPNVATSTWSDAVWNPDLSSITDWTDVRIRWTCPTDGGGGPPGNSRSFAVSFAEIEVAVAGTVVVDVAADRSSQRFALESSRITKADSARERLHGT